jgi:two-component system, cell cycle sensor histidine kinase and response regulator CckA
MADGEGGMILVVEDDLGVSRLQQKELERAGYRVVCADTAEQTMRRLAHEKIDLILLDYVLPGEVTGLRLFGEIRKAGHDQPVIVVTGFSNETALIWALRAGVRDFITKSPAYLNYLPEAVERVLRQVRTEQQLAESQALLSGVFASAKDAIIVAETDQRITLFNPAAEKMFGWPANQALGQPLNKFIPKEYERLPERTNGRSGEPEGCVTHLVKTGSRGMRANGEEFPIEASVARSMVAGRKLYTIVVRDITEKKQLEARTFRAQRLESIGTLASGIAHDLNNVLTPILMAIEPLQTYVPDHVRQSVLVPLKTSAERGAEMVKQVLSFARGMDGQRSEIQLSSIIEDIEKMLRHTLPKSISIRVACSKQLWAVSADATQIYQVLMNLCVNARDAMPQGGSLTINAQNQLFNENDCRTNPEVSPGPFVLVTIVDSGTGIAPELIDKIFDPFFTTKEIGKGTGLGLSTALGIVKSHGGFLNVGSVVGSGTRFSMYLPAIMASEAQTTGNLQPELCVGSEELVAPAI